MTFHRSFKLDTTYHFKDKILEKLLNMTDFRILLDHKLTLSESISMIVNKANGVLGRNFPYNLEYGSIIRDPHYPHLGTHIHNWPLQPFSQGFGRASHTTHLCALFYT